MAKKLPHIDHYIDFIERVDNHLSCDDTFSDNWISNIPIEEPIFASLLNSFQIASFHQIDSGIEEWNPFSQRPYYEPFHPPQRNLTFEFEYRKQIVRKAILIAHEMMHVLLWEPFFSGYSNKLNRETFTELCLAFEGFCFWYADIYFNSMVNLHFPDGEKVFSRSSVSQEEIHPRSVFSKFVNGTEQDLMLTYIRSFNGYHTELTQKELDLVAKGISTRIYTFYDNSRATVRNYYDFLKNTNVFDEYFYRFCKVQSIPSMIPPGKKALLDYSDFEQYCLNICSHIFPEVIQLCKEDILLVRMRRAIQTRAYFLFNLRFSLLNRHVAASKTTIKKISTSTNRMIDDLENILNEFCVNKDINTSRSLLSLWDRNYELEVRGPSQKNELASNYKLQIHPPLPHHPVLHTKLCLHKLPNKQLIQQCRALLDLVLNREALLSLSAREKKIVLSQTATLLEDLNRLTSNMKHMGARRKQIIRKLETIVGYSSLQKKWTTSLADIEPCKNRFRELTLNYR